MSGFLRALRFLTIIPAGRPAETSPAEFAGSLYYFGLAGAVLGGILALVGLGTDALALGGAGNVLVISLLIILTGGLHLDGLADTADGIFSGRPREQKLEIMRDSRIGVMGVLALWMALTLKVALLGQFAALDKARMLLFMPAAGRAVMVLAAVTFPYARKEGGKGSFVQGAGKGPILVNGVFITVIAFLLFGLPGLMLLLILLGTAKILSDRIALILGGLTGDTYGALCEVTEVLVLLLGAVLKTFL